MKEEVKMKKVLLLVVLAMFVAMPVFAAAPSGSIIGTATVIPGSTPLAGFASVGTNHLATASGPMMVRPVGGTTTTGPAGTVITDPTSYATTNNTASVVMAGAVMPAIYQNLGGGVTADSGIVSLTVTAGANSGGQASAAAQVQTYTVGITNAGLGSMPLSSGWTSFMAP
jgi:hypothetical protein